MYENPGANAGFGRLSSVDHAGEVDLATHATDVDEAEFIAGIGDADDERGNS
jgi:hypothetical protein